MDREAILEIRLRTVRLESYDEEARRIDAAELATLRLYRQTHETKAGRRVKMSRRRKIAKHAEMIERIFSDDIDVSNDAIRQIVALDA